MYHEYDIGKMLQSHALKRRYTFRRICSFSNDNNFVWYVWQQFLYCSQGVSEAGQHAGNAKPPNNSNMASRNKALGFVFLLVIANKCENAEAHKVAAAKAIKYIAIPFGDIHMNDLNVIIK